MKKITLLTFMLLALQAAVFAQADSCFTLHIRPSYAGIPIAFDRIDIENITQGNSFTMGDTLLSNCSVGIMGYCMKNTFSISDCFPNPFKGNTSVQIKTFMSGKMHVELYDLTGNLLAAHDFMLDGGTHLLSVHVHTQGIYSLRATFGGQSRQKKMISTGNTDDRNLIVITSSIPLLEGKGSSEKSQQDISLGDKISLRIHYQENDHPYSCIIDSVCSGLLIAESQHPDLGEDLTWDGYSLAHKRVDLIANRCFALSLNYSDTLIVYKHIFFYDSTLFVSPGNLTCNGLLSNYGSPYYYQENNETSWPYMGWYKYEIVSATEIYPDVSFLTDAQRFLLLYTLEGEYIGIRELSPRHSNFPNVFTIFYTAYPPGHPLYMANFAYITAKITQ